MFDTGNIASLGMCHVDGCDRQKAKENLIFTGAAPGQDPTPKPPPPPPPPPLQPPKWLYRTMGFVGAGDFVLGIRQGEIFLFDPMCLYSKILRILWKIQKWLRSTKKYFDPDPTSGSDLG